MRALALLVTLTIAVVAGLPGYFDVPGATSRSQVSGRPALQACHAGTRLLSASLPRRASERSRSTGCTRMPPVAPPRVTSRRRGRRINQATCGVLAHEIVPAGPTGQPATVK